VFLGRVIGSVVSTKKDERLVGFKLLVVQRVAPTGEDEKGYLVAVDTVSAGYKETVLIATGSSARMAQGCQDRPVDAAIVGIVDTVDFLD
jgi:microcompartment protein CcmK/EutM